MRPKSQEPLPPKHERKRTGNQQQVIKLTVHEARVKVRLEHPSIQRIQPTAQQEEWIPPVAERSHNAVMMIAPASSAMISLAIRIMPHCKPAASLRKALRVQVLWIQ